MSGTGNCYDNAPKESFISTLKTECASAPFATRQEARRAIFEYIEVWTNAGLCTHDSGLSAPLSSNSNGLTKPSLSVDAGQGQ